MTDFSQVRADEALLNALGTAISMEEPSGELAELLVAWRQDVDSEPIDVTHVERAATALWTPVGGRWNGTCA